MKIKKRLFKNGGSLAIIIGKEILNGSSPKPGDEVELDLNSVKIIKKEK